MTPNGTVKYADIVHRVFKFYRKKFSKLDPTDIVKFNFKKFIECK